MREHRDLRTSPEHQATTGLWWMLLINRAVGPHHHITDADAVFPLVPKEFTPQNTGISFGVSNNIDVVRVHQNTTITGCSAVSQSHRLRFIQIAQQAGQLPSLPRLNRNQVALKNERSNKRGRR